MVITPQTRRIAASAKMSCTTAVPRLTQRAISAHASVSHLDIPPAQQSQSPRRVTSPSFLNCLLTVHEGTDRDCSSVTNFAAVAPAQDQVGTLSGWGYLDL